MDQKLLKLVEELTTSGEPQLNPEKMKELKKVCKSSEEQLSCAYRLLKTQLTQDHAEVRLSAFQIVDELFTRSHQFRVLLVSDFQEFLELTLGTNHEQPLPPPREAAQRLRQAALRAVEGWNERFGEAYKKLALGYHFLKHTKKVDFQDVNGRTLAERQQEEQKQRHLDRIYRERAKQAEREMEEMSAEVGCCLTEVENCFRLLVPLDFDPCPEASFLDEGPPGSLSSDWEVPHWSSTPDAPDEPCCSKDLPASAYHPGATGAGEGPPQAATGDPLEDEEQPCCSKDLPASAQHSGAAGAGEGCQAAVEDAPQDECSGEQFVRSHGLGSHKYSLDVELPLDGLKVQENDDNLAVLHAARDAIKLIQNKFLPAVCSWVQRFTRAGTHGGHLRCAIDLKAKLELALRKYEELHVQPEWGPRSKTEAPGDEEDEDDEDFVEVPEKEGAGAQSPSAGSGERRSCTGLTGDEEDEKGRGGVGPHLCCCPAVAAPRLPASCPTLLCQGSTGTRGGPETGGRAGPGARGTLWSGPVLLGPGAAGDREDPQAGGQGGTVLPLLSWGPEGRAQSRRAGVTVLQGPLQMSVRRLGTPADLNLSTVSGSPGR
ncbi:UV-stimulated scaffold protein A isoform X3 [Marmota flaviventris]|uniref:UV-stimulated scaffold protein A isoform X3 n=1 Tax=Marmota flaviventris TaxID=93162 RepID=UPI003A88C1A3